MKGFTKSKSPAKNFQSVKAGPITPRKSLAQGRKPRGVKTLGSRSGLKKGAGG